VSIADRASRLIERHAAHVPEMAARLARVGLAVGGRLDAEQWARVPLLRKSALRELQAAAPPWGGLLAEAFHPSACFMSPGGIVEPLVPRMVERLARLLGQAGFGAKHRVLNGFSYHVTPAGLLFHQALVEAGCSVLPAGPQNTALQAEYAQVLGANAFVGIASHLKVLFDQQPALQIRLAMAGAEPHVAALRAQLLAEHGVRSFDMYGFAEAGVIAVSCAEAGHLHLDADALVEVVDPASGSGLAAAAAGELVVSLDNPGFPLLRFATGDLVEIDAVPCACGRPGVLRVLGRTDQSVRVKGMLLHASQLRQFLDRTGLDACRVVVSREAERDRIAVSVRPAGAAAPAAPAVPSPAVPSPDVARIRMPFDTASLAAAFRETCRLGADRIDVEPGLASGSCTFDDRRRS
jgi:phenylacetate-CoA ligase